MFKLNTEDYARSFGVVIHLLIAGIWFHWNASVVAPMNGICGIAKICWWLEICTTTPSCLKERTMKTNSLISVLRNIKLPCHWNKQVLCTIKQDCNGCKYRPADEDKSNGKNDPVFIGWEITLGAPFPYCPSCGEMPYSTERCVFCGQKFIQDEAIAEYNKPPETVIMDCPVCKGNNTMIGAQAKCNGHFHGKCEKCGCKLTE